MRRFHFLKKLVIALIVATIGFFNYTFAADSFIEALSSGKFDLLLNYRFEHVDDPTTLKDAYASTLRTVIGYETERFYGFGINFELEDVSVIGNELFNDGGANGKIRYAVVVDPDGTEINQAYLSFGKLDNITFFKDTEIKAGRQLITYRKAPFHRFIGPVVWRQNWQTFDGYTLSNQSLPDTNLHLGYIYNINRIFGEDNPTSGLHDKSIDGYLFNVQYDGFSLGRLEGYSYLLDFGTTSTSPSAFFQSTQTFGGRFNGEFELNPRMKLHYAIEAAHQSDYAQNPNDIDSNYYLGELGITYTIKKILDSVTLKINYELLEGDGGTDRFTSPLATLHPYQGWADKFLNTPGDGIEDVYLTFIAKAFGARFMAVYHDYDSNNDSYDYGSELNLLLTKPFGKHVTVGLKYADYDADKNFINVSRNPIQSNDINKFWGFISIKF